MVYHFRRESFFNYNSLTFNFRCAMRLASLSCAVAQWICFSRIRAFSLICWERNCPSLRRMTPTQSKIIAHATQSMVRIIFINMYQTNAQKYTFLDISAKIMRFCDKKAAFFC